MSFGEHVEDVIGRLNIIESLLGIVTALAQGDMGYRFEVPRADKTGKFSFAEIETLLRTYGVETFWYGFSGSNLSFRVKKRQARWAEYVLLHAGVELLNPAFDHRNAGYAASHPPGWMPRPWSAGPSVVANNSTDSGSKQEPEPHKGKGLLAWLDSL